MSIRFSRRKFLVVGWIGGASLCLNGCGTVLHPERRGQPAGPLDWKIVALNTLGLLLFFIPGVIAFAVDFSNGTIYLPTHPAYAGGNPQPEFRALQVPREQLSQERIEQIVAAETDQPIRLSDGNYHTMVLGSMDDFAVAERRMIAAFVPSRSESEILRAQSP